MASAVVILVSSFILIVFKVPFLFELVRAYCGVVQVVVFECYVDRGVA